jgi:transcriptional regulator with XRE-family HTH domain
MYVLISESESSMSIAQKLRHRRHQLSLTQAEVAARADMSVVQYNGYENDRHEPSDTTLARLARALQTSATELRDGGGGAQQSAAELKEAFRRKFAQEHGVPPNSVEIFVKW